MSGMRDGGASAPRSAPQPFCVAWRRGAVRTGGPASCLGAGRRGEGRSGGVGWRRRALCGDGGRRLPRWGGNGKAGTEAEGCAEDGLRGRLGLRGGEPAGAGLEQTIAMEMAGGGRWSGAHLEGKVARPGVAPRLGAACVCRLQPWGVAVRGAGPGPHRRASYGHPCRLPVVPNVRAAGLPQQRQSLVAALGLTNKTLQSSRKGGCVFGLSWDFSFMYLKR